MSVSLKKVLLLGGISVSVTIVLVVAMRICSVKSLTTEPSAQNSTSQQPTSENHDVPIRFYETLTSPKKK